MTDLLAPAKTQGEEEMTKVPSGAGHGVDPTIGKVLDQGFANAHDAAQAARERRRDAADNVAEQTRVLFLEEKFKVGVREAEASRRLDDNKLAENILGQRAAKQQPTPDEE
jgi:hypothetical protein